MESIHGGDWAGFENEYGRLPLDFSQNVNPLGMPASVRAAAERSLIRAASYPDPLCRKLNEAIAGEHGVSEKAVFSSNGAAEIIWRVLFSQRPKRVLLCTPGFSEYEAAADAAGCEIVFYELREENDFAVREDILSFIDGSIEMMILCEPANPTGQVTEPSLLKKIADKCRDCGVLLAADECFLPFLEDCEDRTMIRMTKDHPGILVLRAFTKFYSLAGLRLGYCICSDEELIGKLYRAGQPWSVSVPAQEAGLEALKEKAFYSEAIELIKRERTYLEEGLHRIFGREGVRVIPGRANYILFFLRDEALSKGFAGELAQKGILIRDCSNFKGLGSGWFRIAVRKHEDNEVLIRMAEEVSGNWQND